MEKYLNTDEKELLSLIHHHRKHYENTKAKQGGVHADDLAIMKVLDDFEKLLQTISDDRKVREDIKRKPVLVSCPDCDIEKERKPTGEERSEYGYMCNTYHCDECQIDYHENQPNNAMDQLKWYEEFAGFLEKNAEELSKLTKEEKKVFKELKEQGEKFKKASELEEAALKNLHQAEHARDAAIAQMRDYLLVAKINTKWGSTPVGES